MYRWRHNLLIQVLRFSVIAEAACFFGAWVATPEKALFKLFLAYHRPALAVAGLLVPELHEDDPNISMLESAIVWVVVIAGALLQWFLVFLGFALLRKHCFGKKT